MNDRELIAGLDLCRPGADDLRQSELAAVAEQVASDPRAQAIRVRIERVDTALRAAMHDLTPPAGFEARLISRLRNAMSGQAEVNRPGDSNAAATVTLPAGAHHVFSRRRWLGWTAGMATAAAAVVAGVIFLSDDKPLYEEHLGASREWHKQLSKSGEWLGLRPDDLAEHSLPSELRETPRRYRDATSLVGRDAYAYDLTAPGSPRATLFVIQQADDAFLSAAAPLQPQVRTHGYSVAYWQRGDVIYVVVVESDRVEDYHMLLRTSVPLAA